MSRMYKVVKLTIVDLFNKVWETPVVKLVHEIGISDVALAKACRKAGFLIVRNNPIPSENPPDSLAIPGVSGIPLSDGVQLQLVDEHG